jgi:hypothetical protein
MESPANPDISRSLRKHPVGEIFAAYCPENIGDNIYPRRINYFTLQQINIVIFTTSVGKIL